MNKGRDAQQVEMHNSGPRVSELLKASRERNGQDLQTVSAVLRIRYVYLEAIEAGRFEDLPGKTYVVGFVRAYSEYLGLDAEEVVKNFKAEVNGLGGRSELMFPSPVTEQSIPGGAIILIGLVLLGIAYGGWYFLSSQNRSVAELVPDLPAKFAELVNNVKNSSQTPDPEETAGQAEGQAAEQPAGDKATQYNDNQNDAQLMAERAREAVNEANTDAQSQLTELQPSAEIGNQSTGDAQQDARDLVAAETAEKIDAQSDSAQTVTEATEAQVSENVKVEGGVVAPETPTNTVSETVDAVEDKVETIVSEVAGSVAEVVEEVTNTTEAEPQEAPEPEVVKPFDAKIVLKAIDYSWVQITDKAGTVIHTQVLNEGQEYETPKQHGMVLRTGNAGGLEIYVNDVKVPAIGEAGEVRRNVLLDPVRLEKGQAVEN